MSQALLSVEEFRKCLPKRCRTVIDKKVIDNINSLIVDPDEREAFRENLISYTSVLADGRFKTSAYIDAVHYVTYKLLGDTNVLAYSKAFPKRYQRHIDTGKSTKDIASIISSYNKTILVAKIMEQTLVPSYILNQDLYQKALNVQADLMLTANSEKVRTDAANSLLTHLKMPETQKVELDVSVKENPAIDDLRKATLKLVAAQKQGIEAGASSVKDIAHSKIVQGEVLDG